MKKDTTTIKRILRQTDNTNLYGYFQNEDDFVISNGFSVILSDVNSNGDFITDFENLNNAGHYDFKLFADYIKNNIEEQNRNGSETIEILVNDLKMWKKHGEKRKPFIIPTKKGLMGVNPSYLLDLATLTRQDKNNTLIKIKVIDKKAPLYIDGNGVKALLCPVVVDSTEKTYDNFKNKLVNCYNLEKTIKQAKQEQKAHISTDKIGKDVIYNGFTLYFASRTLFILSDKKRVTNDITNDFMKIMSDITGIDYINKITENDYKYYKSGVQAATLLKTVSYSGKEEIYRIETKYNSENFYKNEYDRLIIYNGNMEKIDICADDMSATDPETTETKTSDIVKADTCTDTDKAATTDTATNDRKKVLHGFYMTFKNRDIFVATNEETKRRYIVQAFINEMINISNHLKNITEEKRNNILNDEDVLKETKKRITPATIEEICTLKENHIRITTNNGNTIINQTLNDFKTIVIDCFNANEGMTPKQKHAFKFFSGISRLNNQLTETITQDIKADLQADNRQTETTQDIAPTTQDKPQKTSKKAMCLFVVTSKPDPVKLPHLKPLNNIPMFQERFKTDFKPLKNNKGYNTRVKELKPLKKAYNDFVGTVSCYNDKYAISGDMVAVNSS